MKAILETVVIKDSDFTLEEISKYFGINIGTVRRRIKKWELKRKRPSINYQGEKNPMYGRERTVEYLEERAIKMNKFYYMFQIDGVDINVKNLKLFCINEKISHDNILSSIKSGKSQYKHVFFKGKCYV
jgi:hypothetical protein